MSTCYADPNPTFMPAMRLISSISQTNPAQVTTTFEHGYVSGIIVRLDVPKACGMEQINEQTGTITVNGVNTFTIDINATLFEAFAIPGSPNPHVNTCALVVPIGEVNETLRGAVQNVLPGGSL